MRVGLSIAEEDDNNDDDDDSNNKEKATGQCVLSIRVRLPASRRKQA